MSGKVWSRGLGSERGRGGGERERERERKREKKEDGRRGSERVSGKVWSRGREVKFTVFHTLRF